MDHAIAIVLFGCCFAYTAYDFRRRGMHLLTCVFALACAAALAGQLCHWSIALRALIFLVVAGSATFGVFKLRNVR